MPITPRSFSFWWKGSPVLDTGDGTKFNRWWKGSPVVQTGGEVNTYTVVGSGGITVGGTATVAANVSNLQYGGVTVGGAAPITVNYQTVHEPGIVIGSYVGNGGGARSIAGVAAATGICVMVMGIDGSNKEVGAVKIAGMASGKSHPWKEQPTTGDSARDNRITSIDPTGFSVGADLNQNGLVYTYVIWPYIDGVTEAGSWVGDGTILPARMMPGTLAIANPNASAVSAFDPSDVGRVLWDLDTNTPIGTITSYVNSSNIIVSGGVNGSYTSGHWSIGKRTLRSLGFVPDLVIVVADQTLAEDGTAELTPLQLSPGMLGDKLGTNGTIQNFAGSGTNPAQIAIYSGTADIVQVGSGGSSAAWNDSGVTYRYFAVKTVVGSAFFDKVDYTGDGAGSRTLSGLSFGPEFGIFTGKSKVAGWKPQDTAALAAANSSVLNDGGIEEASNIAFTSDGATFGSSNSFNTSSVVYRAYFLKPGVTGRGGITIGGAATCAFRHVVIAMTGSGGIVVGGAAATVVNFELTSSGGVTTGGAASVDVDYAPPSAGGVTVGGSGAVDVTYDVTGSGGVVVGGAADVSTNTSTTYTVVGSGGIVVGGEAAIAVQFVVPPCNASCGGGVFDPDVFDPDVFDASGGGACHCGVVVGGAATVVFTPKPPVPPTPKPTPSGAVGGADLVRQPFWAAPAVRVTATIIEPCAELRAELRTVEDELSSEENQLLGLL